MTKIITSQSQNSDETINSLKEENTLLIKEVHKLQELLETVYLEEKEFLDNGNIDKPAIEEKIYYGAVEKIKTGLPYQLGSKIINTPLRPKRIINLPRELYTLYVSVPKVKGNLDLSKYKDATEAEKVKNHLSYKIGNTLVEGLSSPAKFVKMPVKMAKEIIIFKKKR